MDANARPHRANIVDECLLSEDITRMDWPAYSPDLNPIEHVWDMLGRRIAARQLPPTCLLELRRALLDEWCNIPQDQIDNLILSMPRRYGEIKPLDDSIIDAFEKAAEEFLFKGDTVIVGVLDPPSLQSRSRTNRLSSLLTFKKTQEDQNFRTEAEVQRAFLARLYNLDTDFNDAGFDGLSKC
ncbi:transposable element Tcb2 transposase [Trichonephila clavipes]|nr:transposable element Tcb2 transposase [Trichonephila clavipes]